ncbi:hypothetical protein [Methylorubrum populi]|uniref:hypothetical protein n=1 Tax=Methylorubrum populi TaxID=223967 RepID=UPI00186B1DDD|nr:hypothetical protein [Methylorubrum populi]
MSIPFGCELTPYVCPSSDKVSTRNLVDDASFCFEIASTPGRPDTLRSAPGRRGERRLGIATVLLIRIAVGIVEQEDDPVHDIERQLGQPLELSSRDGGGRDAAAAGKANNVRHGSPPGLQRIDEEGGCIPTINAAVAFDLVEDLDAEDAIALRVIGRLAPGEFLDAPIFQEPEPFAFEVRK